MACTKILRRRAAPEQASPLQLAQLTHCETVSLQDPPQF